MLIFQLKEPDGERQSNPTKRGRYLQINVPSVMLPSLRRKMPHGKARFPLFHPG